MLSAATSTLKRGNRNKSSSSKRQKKETSYFNILDIPEEILIQIVLYINARERIALANCCRRLNSLVFGNKTLLADLDFSEEGHLTSATDIWRYFNNKNALNHILKVNIENTNCIKPGYQLNNSIGKAINLVDINLHGTNFKDVWQLGSFLQPLVHIQRLSVDWTEQEENNILLSCKVLQKSFSRLIYLSVKMEKINLFAIFIPSLRLCQELRELRMVVKKPPCNPSIHEPYNTIWSGEPGQLKNLKIVEYYGHYSEEIKQRFVTLLPDPEKWADFQVFTLENQTGFWLGNTEVCEELLRIVPNAASQNRLNLRWNLYPELLLKEALRISHLYVPENFCCLSKFMNGERCLTNIKDTKRLLKNPASQISYLYVTHPIETRCDLHLLASAFPNLTELVLTGVTRDLKSLSDNTHFGRRLRKCGSVIHEKNDDLLNLDSSFEMLIDNTPHLRHLTLGRHNGFDAWDLDELYLIPKWKNLETLRLWYIPIEDGYFLIKIGKQCKHLQKLELIKLHNSFGYKKELLQMLTHCENLTDFSIIEESICLSELLASLANNVELRRVRMQDIDKSVSIDEWISSIKQLLYQCSKLSTFVCKCRGDLRSSQLFLAIESLKCEINRPNFQFQILRKDPYAKLGTLHEDTPHSSPFP